MLFYIYTQAKKRKARNLTHGKQMPKINWFVWNKNEGKRQATAALAAEKKIIQVK